MKGWVLCQWRASPTHDGYVHFHGQHMKFISIELWTSIWFLVTEHDRTKWHWACLSKAMNSKRLQSISNPSLPCPFPCTTHEVMVPVIMVFPFSCVVTCGYSWSCAVHCCMDYMPIWYKQHSNVTRLDDETNALVLNQQDTAVPTLSATFTYF